MHRKNFEGRKDKRRTAALERAVRFYKACASGKGKRFVDMNTSFMKQFPTVDDYLKLFAPSDKLKAAQVWPKGLEMRVAG